MKNFILKPIMALFVWLLAQVVFAQNLSVIRIASPDLSTTNSHAAGGVVDVLYTKKWLEQEFAKQNIQVQWYFFKGAGPAINEALANKQVDFAFLGDLPPIIGKAGGLDTELLAATTRGLTNYLAVRADADIHTLQQLKGKRVGILRGTADEISLVAALKSQGLTTKDVHLINLDFNAVNAALVAKKIDASWGPSRFFSLRDKGIVKLPISTKQLNGAGASQGVFLGRKEFIQQYPQETQQIVNQVVNGLNWLSQDDHLIPQVALFFTQSGYPASVYAQELHGVNLKFLYSPLFDPYFNDQLQQKVNLAQSQGLIRHSIDVKTWVNQQFVNTAIINLKLQHFWSATDRYQYLK
ncbi:ABC transporter substrate-binding protein [Acinetobacter sp. B10A]|uniref:ABC transporter substrate-binding protein n=1 Tax=Acinetobacter baretiae TaxID=2605383 RepID=UPI001B3C5915|nr:ABC transporter substrate-binding protein [Acinetobacter baretiae]MBF7685428.1 ABC transporter substrate-binding protein [Acinetobacter baretiae]